MNVTYFRKRTPGVESILEDRIADQLNSLFNPRPEPYWVAGSIPLGASRPDLLMVYYGYEVFSPTPLDKLSISVLAFLRCVDEAKPSTIEVMLSIPEYLVEEKLIELKAKNVIVRSHNSYSISNIWKEILPEVISIEIKVSNWKKALQQAKLNRIFSHKSYIAVPDAIAERVSNTPNFRSTGIGLISISLESQSNVLIEAANLRPKVWSYYYSIAAQLGKKRQENRTIK